MYQGVVTGQMLRHAREAAGVSLGAVALRSHFAKSHLSRVERGERGVTLDVIQAYERELGEDMHRRSVIIGIAALTMVHGKLAREIYASLAGGDGDVLSSVQTTHGTDMVIASLTERPAIPRLTRWMTEGAEPVLRVNAAGILAKLPGQQAAKDVALALTQDPQILHLYTTAVVSRVCAVDWSTALSYVRFPADAPQPVKLAQQLSHEAFNASDAGARWCSAYMLRELSPMLGAA